MDKKRLSMFFAFFFLALACCANAISIGNSLKYDYQEIALEQSARFKILFWNSGNEPYTMEIRNVESPEGWTVIIDPASFLLDKETGEEYISLPYMNENIRAKIVNVFVKPPQNEESGNYSFTIVSQITSQDTGQLTMVPKNSFILKVGLRGIEPDVVEDDFEEEIIIPKENYEDKEESSIVFILVIATIAIALLLYKKY
ncbi:MAG: hypothetical protein JW700_01050 [Candidatus Aenigmarchaeota archaeon]|nr:hypothetical protein [Candidatus Aenigmarchaeota archaeon]